MRREVARLGHDRALPDLLVVDVQRDRPGRGHRVALAYERRAEMTTDRSAPPGRLHHLLVAADEVVGVLELAVLDVQRVAAEACAVREQDAVGSADSISTLDRDRVTAVADVRPRPTRESPPCPGSRRSAPVVGAPADASGRRGPQTGSPVDRAAVPCTGRRGGTSGRPSAASFTGSSAARSWHLGRVPIGVVELPAILVEVAPAGDRRMHAARPSIPCATRPASRASRRTPISFGVGAASRPRRSSGS